MPRVTFLPANVSVEVAPGTNLLEAAREGGVRIHNECGGQGACGRCIVRVLSGEGARLGTRHELRPGQDLACRFLALESDVTVFVPPASQEVSEGVTVRRARAAPGPGDGALVKRARLELSAPTLEDSIDDAHRLLRGLERWREGMHSMPLSAVQRLPGRLRAADWRPEVTVGVVPGGTRLLDAEAGAGGGVCLLAVDIGTTSLKAQLLCSDGGWTASCYNSQVAYGPDVIARIIYCQQHEDGLRRMQSSAVGDINRVLGALLDKAGLDRGDVHAVVLAGNTTMVHLLLGVEPLWIRREPYVGGSYCPEPFEAAQIGVDIHPAGLLYCVPCISAYVGGDVTAGVLATGLAEGAELSVLMDLGTNGEVVVGNREFTVCCSASAGPAFEGEASASGTRARPGAIESLWFDRSIRWKTIGNATPRGICGSGYIDLLAVLFRQGVIDRTGRFRDGSSKRLRTGEHGLTECVIVGAEDAAGTEDIVFLQADIDNLVRAKGAIYAAATVLLESLGMDWPDVDRIMLAGAFGDKIDVENAVQIGLLPDVARDKIGFVGNTSLQGAVMAALNEDDYARVEAIARATTHFELSTHHDYMDAFIGACFLPHTDTEKFPSVQQG